MRFAIAIVALALLGAEPNQADLDAYRERCRAYTKEQLPKLVDKVKHDGELVKQATKTPVAPPGTGKYGNRKRSGAGSSASPGFITGGTKRTSFGSKEEKADYIKRHRATLDADAAELKRLRAGNLSFAFIEGKLAQGVMGAWPEKFVVVDRVLPSGRLISHLNGQLFVFCGAPSGLADGAEIPTAGKLFHVTGTETIDRSTLLVVEMIDRPEEFK